MEANTTASRATSVLSLLAGLLIIVIGGGLVGMAVAVVGSIFYLIVVFPIGMGFASGLIAGVGARVARVWQKRQLTLFFVLAALVVYGIFHYGRYVIFQLGTWLELASSEAAQSTGAKVDFKVAKVFADYALKEETGHPGFLGYMLYRAENGISIGKFYSQNSLELTGILAWLYWILEFGLILWIMDGMAKSHLHRPHCESCGRSLGREKHLGGTTPANEPLLLDLLRRQDLAGLGQLLVKDAGLPSVEVYMRKCEACGQSISLITVRRASLGAKGVVLDDVSKATLPPQDSVRFLQQLSFEVD